MSNLARKFFKGMGWATQGFFAAAAVCAVMVLGRLHPSWELFLWWLILAFLSLAVAKLGVWFLPSPQLPANSRTRSGPSWTSYPEPTITTAEYDPATAPKVDTSIGQETAAIRVASTSH